MVSFRIGEKVRLTINLAQTKGLVNGITGRIVGFTLQNARAPYVFNWVNSNVRAL